MCNECAKTTCPGQNKLRHFEDWSDLSSHLDEDAIVKFINHYAQMIGARDDSGKRYRLKQQALAEVAKKYLDPDEIEALARQAEEKLR